ncbi:MAG: SEC-C metal-binding domain-containing protein [Acidimicrobiia bacterium]|nr:SEC-C metal-binding domain-containing protein [Acidimicrobiia bacterium]MDH5290285.1 SEC-C metal-binding domain-containing protein [Acidimicrobiia bacterium]
MLDDELHPDEPDLDGLDPDDLADRYLSDAELDAVGELARARLADGPILVDELLAAAADAGIVDRLVLDLDADDLDQLVAELLDDLLTFDPELWATDRWIDRVERVLAGRVFTHRLTADELAQGWIDPWPDLQVLNVDHDDPDPFEAQPEGGSKPSSPAPIEPAFDQADGDRLLLSAEQWSTLAPGDLIAVRRRGAAMDVEPVEPSSFGSGQAEGEAMAAAVAAGPGRGVPVVFALMDALMDDPALFTRPVPPVRELVAAAGLSTDGVGIGPADRIWDEPGAERMMAERAVSSYDLDECCLDALALVNRRWRAELLGLVDLPDTPPLDEVVEALGHGDVGPALADATDRPGTHDSLRAFARTLLDATDGDDPRSLGPRLLSAYLLERDGDLAAAEELYRRVHDRHPDSPAALEGLAFLAFDRSDFTTAARFLRRIYEPDYPLVNMTEQLAACQVIPGRNDRCPCGSGRKYKACHPGQAFIHPEQRITVVLAKLANFALSRPRRDELATTALMAGLEPDTLLGSRFLFERYLLDAGNAAEYRRLRGSLLPADEAELLDRLIGLAPRIVEVIDVRPSPEPGGGATVTLRPLSPTGDDQACDLGYGDPDLEPGQVAMVHLLDRSLVGQVALVEPDQRASLAEFLAGGPLPLVGFLSWFANVPVS